MVHCTRICDVTMYRPQHSTLSRASVRPHCSSSTGILMVRPHTAHSPPASVRPHPSSSTVILMVRPHMAPSHAPLSLYDVPANHPPQRGVARVGAWDPHGATPGGSTAPRIHRRRSLPSLVLYETHRRGKERCTCEARVLHLDAGTQPEVRVGRGELGARGKSGSGRARGPR